MPAITEAFLRSRRSKPSKEQHQARFIDGDLMVKVGRGGAVTFYNSPTREASGKQRVVRIGRWDQGVSINDARTQAKALRKQIKAHPNPDTAETIRPNTFGEAYVLAMNDKAEKTSAANVQRYRDCWLHLKHLKDKPIAKVTRKDIEIVFDKLVDAKKFKTANVTKRVASFALLNGHNPALVFDPIKDHEDGERPHEGRIRTPKQWNKIIDLARSFSHQTEGNAVICQAIWGARYNEVRHLQWDWVDEESGTINIPPAWTKNKKLTLYLPIIDLVPSILAEQLGKSNIWVFPKARNSEEPAPHSKNFWKHARKQLNRAVSAHDLRHAWKTAAVEIGIDEIVRDRMQDHAIRKSSGGYYTPSSATFAKTGQAVIAHLRGETA